MMRHGTAGLGALALAALLAAGAAAQERGPVTDLPMPRYVSLNAEEANARRGPGTSHRIDWVFRHRSMPLRVTAEFEHWRRVEDSEGEGGWIHYALLSGVRTVRIEAERTTLRLQPDARAPEVAHLEQGVIARLLECRTDWCRLNAGGERGWAEREGLWGVEAGEVFD